MTDPARRLMRAEDAYFSRRFAASTSGVPVAEWAFQTYPPSFIGRPRPDLSRRGQTADVETRAEVNQGRWVARCPFCPSAQVVTPDDPRFLCAGADGCANGPVRGAFVKVVFPAETTRDRIEAVLMRRPEMKTRNWRRTETVAALIEENEANGLDGP